MKKLIVVLVLFLLVGCTEKMEKPKGKHYAGSVSVTNMKFEDAVDKKGSVQINTTIANVVLDDTKKVIYVDIDTAQNKGGFDSLGQVEDNQAIASKKELKEDYKMKQASPIGKEWYEQIAHLESWMMGKTLEEIQTLEIDPEGYPLTKDVVSGCTMKVKDYLKAVEKAIQKSQEVENAMYIGSANQTQLKSSDAKETLGVIQSNTTFSLVGLNEKHEIVYVLIDTDQNATLFNEQGQVEQSDIKLSKKLLKEEYKMKQASSIGKEWYEQIEYLEAYLKNHTLKQLSNIQIDEEGYPLQSDVTSGTTMKIDTYLKTVEKAMKNAKERS